MSARDAASRTLKATGLPLTFLDEPRHLDDRILDLVAHAFAVTGVAAASNDLSNVRDWVKESQTAHEDVWSIPLFAVLLAVQAAQTPIDRLPTTRAAAIVAAINDSVTRWEQQKSHEPSAWHPDLHPELLLNGFADIGHEIVGGDVDVDGAAEAVAQTAMTGWGQAPNRARAVASDIVRWWVDRVGVFTVTDGILRARVRLMGEAADAMWAARQTPAHRAEWVQRALEDVDRHREPTLLAAALEPKIAEELIEAANEPDAVLLAADAISEGAAPRQRALALLVGHLVRLADDPPPLTKDAPPVGPAAEILTAIDEHQRRHDGPAWRYLGALAKLPLPRELRSSRDKALDDIEDLERRVVATALTAVADCTYDDRLPLDDERASLEAVLELRVPERESVEHHRSRRHLVIAGSEPILSGRAEAVTGAIRLIGLSEHTATAAARLATQIGMEAALPLIDAINRAGFSDAVNKTRVMSVVGGAFRRILSEDHSDDDRFILEVAASSTTRATPRREPTRRWRLSGVAALFEVLKPGAYPVGTPLQAVKRFPDLVRHIVNLAVIATGQPPDVIAEEASRAIELLDSDPLGTVVMLHVPPHPLRTARNSIPRLTVDDFASLRSCVVSGNSWLFVVGAEWLANSGKAEALELLWDALLEVPPRHRAGLAGWLAEATGRGDVYASWLVSGDAILRLVAVRAVAKVGLDRASILAFASDSDLTVRLETLRSLAESGHEVLFEEAVAQATAAPPTAWTCRWCGSIEPIALWDCASCPEGDREDLEEEIRRFRSN